MLQAEPGDCDLPAAVAAAAKEAGWAFDLGTPSANAIEAPPQGRAARLYARLPAASRGHVRYYVDVETGVVDSAPARSSRDAWPDNRRAEAR